MRPTISPLIFILMLQSPSATTVEEILRNYEEAMGGADAIKAVETIMTVSELSASGFTGVDTVVSMKPDKFYEDIDIGILRQVSITDGTGYWTSDHTGQTREAAGRERDLLQITAYFANFRHLYPDERVAELVGEIDGCYVVAYCIVEDLPVTVYFDKNNWLIIRSEADTDFGRSVTEYSDYREVDGGIMLPHTIVQVTGPQEITSRITQVYINEKVTEERFYPLYDENNDAIIEEDCVDIPIGIVKNLVFVGVSVDGSSPLKFLLDTGAGMTVVDGKAVDIGGEVEIPAMGVGGIENAALSEIEYLAVGGAKLLNPTVAALDLSGIGTDAGVDIDGILGYDFISHFIIKIDYDNQLLSIYDPANFDYPDDIDFIPLEFISNVPLIDMSFDDFDGKFFLDTGNGLSVILHGPFVNENELMTKYRSEGAMMLEGVGGRSNVTAVKADVLQFGSFDLRDPVLFLSTADDSGFAMASAIGNVGGEVLSRFTVYLDYSNSRIGLIPGAKFDKPFPTR